MNTLIKKAQHRYADAFVALMQEKFFKTWLTRILINNCNQEALNLSPSRIKYW